jgi:uncharacterized Rmd1/YagE family protein
MEKSEGIAVGQWSGSDATKELTETLKKFNDSSEKQTKQMVKLTWVITILTFFMLIGLIVQIYMAVCKK